MDVIKTARVRSARNRRSPFILGMAVLFILGACASTPRNVPQLPGQDGGIEAMFAPLEPDALVYLWADVPGTRPILDRASFAGFDGKSASDLLDRTEFVAAAVYPQTAASESAETGRSFMAAARGRYPVLSAGLAFSFSPSWKKRKSPTGNSYWYSKREGLSIALYSRNALVSDGDPFPKSGNPQTPSALGELSRGAVLAGWITSAAEPLNRFITQLGLPIQIPAQQLIFALYPSREEGTYETALYLETASESQAQALSSMIAMLRIFMPQELLSADSTNPMALAGAVFAYPPVTQGTAIVLHSAPMKPETIALLFNMFSLYSP
ncbi:MAG: hypothetical protein LBG76_08595 [Treponema sp.]|jgi:hypothetical protein|nr:hypothetical protein [Treponema sp.]